MKKILLLLTFIIQGTINAQTYYDANDNEISKKVFDEQLLKKGFFGVTNDTLNKHKIMFTCDRRENGTLGDAPNLFKVLTEKLHLPLDYNKPLIIYYYPGKDPCNSSGTATRQSEMEWQEQLDKKIKKIAKVNTLYVYKNARGIRTINDFDWKKDPNGLIENLFFNYHYPCSSFVVINKDKYCAFFGEYSHENVVNTLKNVLIE